MNFNELNELIPHVIGKKLHVVSFQPYNAVTIRLPGKHQAETDPPGGDGVILIDESNLDWVGHKFTHTDIFMDIQGKMMISPMHAKALMQDYETIVNDTSEDADRYLWPDRLGLPGIHPQTFLHAVQVLSVIEHRRYKQHEKKGGGRFLPLRFAKGIAEARWSAAAAAERQKLGRPGVEWLEKTS